MPDAPGSEPSRLVAPPPRPRRTSVGVIGCGTISRTYLRTLSAFDDFLDVVALADLQEERARERAAEFSVPNACGVDELLADPGIDLVVNLTVPAAHAAVGAAVLGAGKALYNEKPLAVELADAQQLLELAAERGLRLGAAPDTFLGGALQVCVELLEQGAIGEPFAAVALSTRGGPEAWHPNASFFYQRGGGPLFDLGPYYLSTLISFFGPLRSVSGATRIGTRPRVAGAGPLRGQVIQVETPTHVAGVLEFSAGQIVTLLTSFDVVASELPWMEVYGTEGTLSCPDPTVFGGRVRLRQRRGEWVELPVDRPFVEDDRGIGVGEMVDAMIAGRPHRAGAELGYHVLEALLGLYDSAETGDRIALRSTCPRPEPLPPGWPGPESRG